MEEIWLKVPNYEKYSVSNLGNIKNNFNENLLKFNFGNDEYLFVKFWANKKAKLYKVHQVVAMAFLNHVPCGHKLVVNHINGIKTDNRVENLEIVTNRENTSTCYNPNKVNCSSQYIGVDARNTNNNCPKKWRAQIVINKKKIFLGNFLTELQAKKMYDHAIGELKNGKIDEFLLNRKYYYKIYLSF